MSALGVGEGTKDTVPYYRAKWAAERTVSECGIPHAILRPSFIFGPDGGVLPRFLRIARLAPVTPIVGAGTQRLQPIWVEDIARAFGVALELDEPTLTAELGGPDVVDWNELWRRGSSGRWGHSARRSIFRSGSCDHLHCFWSGCRPLRSPGTS